MPPKPRAIRGENPRRIGRKATSKVASSVRLAKIGGFPAALLGRLLSAGGSAQTAKEESAHVQEAAEKRADVARKDKSPGSCSGAGCGRTSDSRESPLTGQVRPVAVSDHAVEWILRSVVQSTKKNTRIAGNFSVDLNGSPQLYRKIFIISPLSANPLRG